MVTGSIYIIKNKINDKVYIGQTILSVEDRYKQHMKPSKRKLYYKIYRAIEKYNKDNFYYEILETNIPINILNEKEIYYIDKYNSFNEGYNSTKGGDGRYLNKVEDVNYVIDQIKLGRTSKSIAEELNISTATINRALKKMNLTVHDIKVDKEKLIKMYLEGYTYEEISNALKINARTVSRVINRNNINKRYKEYDHSVISTKKILELLNRGEKPINIANKYNLRLDYIYWVNKRYSQV